MENRNIVNDFKVHEEKYLLSKEECRRLCYETKKKDMNRNSMHIKMKQHMKQQRDTISKLLEEKAEEELLLRLQKSASFSNKKNQNLNLFKKSFKDLIQHEQQVERQIDDLNKLNQELDKFEKKAKQRQKEAGKVKRNCNKNTKHFKDISFLENRLDASLHKYNQLLVSNGASRENINSILLTQKAFQEKYQRIKKMLRIGKKAMTDTVHSATVTYQTGESVKYKLNIIKERTHVDQKKLGEKVKELKILVEQDKHFKEFLDLKTRDLHAIGDDIDVSDGKKNMMMEQLTQSYENVMERIQFVSDSKDVNSICKMYAQREESNIALFEKVNVMNLDIEGFHEDLKLQREDLDILTKQYDEQKQKNLAEKNDIENQTENLSNEAQQLEDQTEAKSCDLEMVKDVLRRICSIFHNISSHNISFTVDDGITDDNILQYLESMEQGIFEVLQCCRFVQDKHKCISAE